MSIMRMREGLGPENESNKEKDDAIGAERTPPLIRNVHTSNFHISSKTMWRIYMSIRKLKELSRPRFLKKIIIFVSMR